MTSYWNPRFDQEQGMYRCPEEGCTKMLKPKQAGPNSKNPGRWFVSCSADYGGCGLFSFTDEEPKYLGKNNKKRARTGGTQVLGPLVNQPAAHEQRLGELATEVAELRKAFEEVSQKLEIAVSYIKEVTDH